MVNGDVLDISHHCKNFFEEGLLSDVNFRCNSPAKEGWVSVSCHSVVLAALSPVLRDCLKDLQQDDAVIISEWGREIVDVLYTGLTLLPSREKGMSLWTALSDLGIEASTSITRIDDDDQFNNTRSFHQTSCIHHPIQTPKNPNELSVGSSSMSKQLTLGVGGVDERAQMTSMAGSTSNSTTANITEPPINGVYYIIVENIDNKDMLESIDKNLTEEPSIMTMDICDQVGTIDERFQEGILKSTHEETATNDFTLVEQSGSLAVDEQPVVTSFASPVFPCRASVRQRHNGGGEVHTCDICQEQFFSDVGLATHKADYHASLKCDRCSDALDGVLEFVRHAEMHISATGATIAPAHTRLTCVLCSCKFVTNQALKYHYYKHTGLKPYKCTVCSEVFRTPSTLKGHFQVQHAVSRHICSVCGLQSSTSGKLKIHMRSHTKERPHNCVHCNLSFKQSSTLKLHEFKHKQSLAFQCDRCQKCFPIRSKLVMHMRRQRCHQSRHKLTRKPPPPAECAEVTEMKAKPEDGLFLVECFVDPIQTIGDHLIL